MINNNPIKIIFLIFILVICKFIQAQDTLNETRKRFFIAASGSFSASKNIDIARYLITKSIGGEVGFFLGQKNIISITYEKTKINEYDAKYKNLNFINLNLKRLIPLSTNFQATTTLSAGKASGKYINFGINPQGGSEIEGGSKHAFVELGARYKPSQKIFIELRFLQIGYIDKYIDKQFPSGLKAFVINDDEYFPLRLCIGYRF